MADDARVYGTGWTGYDHNHAAFPWSQVLFVYDHGSVTASGRYPESLPSSNPIGHRFGSESWGLPLNWGASLCGLSTHSYEDATEYISDTDWIITREESADSINIGTLEGVASCTTSDNPGEAWLDIYIR